MSGKPTLRDVAARAGVSKSLVSLVVNDSPLVREPKRRAVLAAIEELGYRPNSAARSLVEGRTRAVGVLVTDLRNPWFVDTVESLNSALHERGSTMLLGDARLDRSADERVLQTFVDLRLDGLLLVGSMTASPAVVAAVRRMPGVVVGGRDIVLPRVDVSVQDDVAGARAATEHLIGLGHRRIAHLGGGPEAVMRLRAEGYVEAMGEHGLADLVQVLGAGMTEDGGFLGGRELLRRDPRPTAVFVAADVAAVGVLRAAARLGLDVPGDVSVVGFDDTPVAALPGTSLTTVNAHAARIGRVAVDLLLDRIADPTRRRRTVVTAPELAIRSSSAAPRTRA